MSTGSFTTSSSVTLGKFEALHTVAASTWGFTVDGDAFNTNGTTTYIDAGDYFWATTAQGGSVSLLSNLQTKLAAIVANTTVSISASTGLLTITWGSGTRKLHPNAAAQTRFGLASAYAAAATAVGTAHVKGLYLPNVQPSDLSASLLATGGRRSDRVITIAKSGAVWGTTYNKTYENLFAFRGLVKRKVWTADEATTNESLETFWSDCLSVGCTLRWHRDATSSSYTEWKDVLREGLGQTVATGPRRMVVGWDGLWDFELPCVSYVHVATGGGF